jgi:hypothetical protein
MEFINMKLKFFVAILLFISISIAHAADLRGKLTGIQGAKIYVVCNGYKTSTTLSNTGGFHVSDLPANQSCHFTVKSGNAESVRIPFSSKNSVTVYNGTLSVFKNKILVVRK